MKQSTIDDLVTTAVIVVSVLLVALILLSPFAIVLGIWWLIWSLWTFVMPQVWPTGPAGLINPGYWLFAGIWVLFVLVARVLRGMRR